MGDRYGGSLEKVGSEGQPQPAPDPALLPAARTAKGSVRAELPAERGTLWDTWQRSEHWGTVLGCRKWQERGASLGNLGSIWGMWRIWGM